MNVASKIASLISAIDNCEARGNSDWKARYETELARIVKEYLPSGSGIDTGTEIARHACTSDRLLFTFSYHHMNENGYYDGWSDHSATVKPTFDGISVKIGGKNRNGVKDMLHDVFYEALRAEVVDI